MLDELEKLYTKLQGDKTARYLLDFIYRSWEGRFDKYAILSKFFRKRIKMFEQLLQIYPDLKIQAEDFEGRHTIEVPAKEYKFVIEYAPIVHYKKLPNEIIIEIDNPSKEELKKVVERLRSIDIESLICWSGHKSWHIHILTFPEDLDPDDYPKYINAEGTKEFTDALYRVILRKTDIEGLDVNVQLSKAHWIRSPYSLNVKEKDGKKKIGIKKPLNGDLYRIWFYGKNFAMLAMMEIELKQEKERKLEKPIVKPCKGKKYKWIEIILKNPDKVQDGRKRLLWLAIVPYLVLQGYNSAQIEDICRKWVENSGEEWKSRYGCLVRYMAKYCSDFKKKNDHPWYPISFSKLLDEYPDLKYLKDVVGGGEVEVSRMPSLDSQE